VVTVRWHLRYGISYRGVEESLSKRDLAVDHVTIYRWVQRFTPLLLDAARPCRHASGDRYSQRDVWESRRVFRMRDWTAICGFHPCPGHGPCPSEGAPTGYRSIR
jgi:hypothetical protein